MFSKSLNHLPVKLNKFVLEKLLNNLSFGVFVLDESLKILFWSKGSQKITGYSSKELSGKSFEDISILEVYQKNKEINFKNLIKDKINKRKDLVVVAYLRHKDNYRFPIEIHFFCFFDEDEQKTAQVGIFFILDMVLYTKKLIKSLKEKANKDFLTSLPNRRFLEYLINKKIGEFSRYDLKFGLILLDIDNFKSINDCLGHSSGDLVLKEFSTLIKKNLRSCDYFGRWGGDEFIAIILNVDMEQLKIISDKLVETIRKKTFKEKKFKFNIFVSAGYTLIKKDDTIDTILERVDQNMYKEKFKKTHP